MMLPAPEAVPPVCRIMDFGKFVYEKTKKEREARKAQTKTLFNTVCPDYDAGPGCFAHFGRRLVEVAHINAGARVLDIASGRGAVLFPVAERVGAGGEVVGIDLADAMAHATSAEAARRGLKARVHVMDAEALTFPDASFDGVTCGFGIMFFPDQDRGLAHMRRVGGGYVAPTDADETWRTLYAALDVFVHDRKTGKTRRVSVSSSGKETPPEVALPGREDIAQNSSPQISANGRHVAFVSYSAHLAPNDTNDAKDVFVHDLKRRSTQRASLSSKGRQGTPDGFSYSGLAPALSADGRYVTFASSASNLVPGDTNGVADSFVRDLRTGRVERFVAAARHGREGRPAPDVVVLDPPRRGAGLELARDLAAVGPPRIVYVACDVAALARDTRTLVDAGYRLRHAVPLDLFPMTHHVEVVATFTR